MKKILYLLAGGKGERFGEDKLLKTIGNDYVFVYVLKKIKSFQIFDDIVLVCDNVKRKIIKDEQIEGIYIASPGKERIDSVRSAFQTITPNNNDIVLIHDAARPNISKELINRVLIATQLHGNGFPAVKINDTIRFFDGKNRSYTINRENLYLIQTPQGFKSEILHKIMSYNLKNEEKVYDEGVILEKLGLKLYLIEGDPFNIKITLKSDYQYLLKILK